MGSVGFCGCSRSPGSSGRYLSGLCVAALGLCAAGWLALAPAAFGYRSGGADPHPAAPHLAASHLAALRRAALADRATAAGLALVSLVTLICWVVAWRRTLRADGILARAPRWQAETSRRQVRTSRRQARRAAREQRRHVHDGGTDARTPDPAQALSELRALLTPLLAQPAANGPAANGRAPDSHVPQEPPEHRMYAPGPASSDLPAVPAPRSGGLAATESTLAGAELLMTGCAEEEAW
jgi:hypothetical protein